MSTRAWLALWTVYILWGSTYLGIELAGETIPPLLSAGIRFSTVGVVLGSVTKKLPSCRTTISFPLNPSAIVFGLPAETPTIPPTWQLTHSSFA